jgi:FKBP-type peptidyl-prolyl cis-trans isomerase
VIPANADLVFEMTLVSLKKNVNIEVTKNVTCTSDQKTRDKDTVKFNYIGKLANGMFSIPVNLLFSIIFFTRLS